PLFLLALTHRIHAEFGQHQRLINREVVQPRDVPAKCGLLVKIDVEASEVSEINRQILGRWEVSVTDERVGILKSNAIDKALDKAAHCVDTVPPHHVGGDLVAHEIAENS